MRPGLFVIALVAAAILFWLMSQAADSSTPDAEVVALGEEVYTQNCAACHGASLEGEPNWQARGADGLMPAPPHDETGHTWHHPTPLLFEIVKQGTEAIVGGDYRSNMPGFGEVLTDDEIEAVLTYIKSTWPEDIRTRHAEMDAAAGN